MEKLRPDLLQLNDLVSAMNNLDAFKHIRWADDWKQNQNFWDEIKKQIVIRNQQSSLPPEKLY